MKVLLYRVEEKLETIIRCLLGESSQLDIRKVSAFEGLKAYEEQLPLLCILPWSTTGKEEVLNISKELNHAHLVGLTPHKEEALADAMHDCGIEAAVSIHQLNSLPLVIRSLETEAPAPITVLDEAGAEVLMNSIHERGEHDELA